MNTKNSDIVFSICVPTRNRADTLFYCLKTLLDQDFSDYEIIISDNSDESESIKTKNVVSELNSERIRYHRPDRILSMTENFEFTLEQASGEYVLFLGDDDGLVTNTLDYIYKKIQDKDPKIIKSPNIVYYWPSSIILDESSLTFPVRRPDMILYGKEVLEQVAAFDLCYNAMPMIYYSFVKRDIIEKITKEKQSFFQDAVSPDIYSGIMLSHYNETFLLTEKPFTIAGLSKKSNGSISMKEPDNEIAREFKKQQKLSEKFEKYDIPVSHKSGFDNTVMFEILLFKDNHNIPEDLYPINYDKFIINKTSLTNVLNRVSEIPNIEEFNGFKRFESVLKHLKSILLSKQVYNPPTGYSSNMLVKHFSVDPQFFHSENVYDIARLCEQLNRSYDSLNVIELDGINTHLKNLRRERIRSEFKSLIQKLRTYSGKLLGIR